MKLAINILRLVGLAVTFGIVTGALLAVMSVFILTMLAWCLWVSFWTLLLGIPAVLWFFFGAAVSLTTTGSLAALLRWTDAMAEKRPVRAVTDAALCSSDWLFDGLDTVFDLLDPIADRGFELADRLWDGLTS